MLDLDDLASLYEDESACTVAGHAGPLRAQFHEAGSLIFGSEVVNSEPALRYPVPLWPELTRGALLNVAGRAWRVRSKPRLLNAGREALVDLELVK